MTSNAPPDVDPVAVAGSAVADDDAGQAEERFVDVGADFRADAQAAESRSRSPRWPPGPPRPVQQGESLLDHPAGHAESGPVLLSPSGDDRRDGEAA
jgi:hypothetical protein